MLQSQLARPVAPKRKKAPAVLVPITDPLLSAQCAGLRYVSDTAPGISRKRAGRGFIYYTPDRKRIAAPELLARIRSLAIPPAWKQVWICPDPNGHIQATARDTKGRKQYRYHARWREVRDATKYDRLLAFGRVLPTIRQQVDADLERPGLPRERALATIVRLLETTLIRVGNEEYARNNESFGLTTMRDHHVDVNGSTLRFEFKGKSGVRHSVGLKDGRLAKIVKKMQDLPGEELFQYVDADGTRHSVESSDVNAYLRQITGHDFTAKDFRTWAGTVLAAKALAPLAPPTSQTQLKHTLVQAIEQVSQRLGNTKAVCRKCYVHPGIFDAFEQGSLQEMAALLPASTSNPLNLQREELWVLMLLEKQLEQKLSDSSTAAAQKLYTELQLTPAVAS